MEFNSKNNKIGRKPKYATDEERAEAKRISARKYYETHKDECREKQNERYYNTKKIENNKVLEKNKQMRDVYKKYKEGKLIETSLL